MNFCGSQSKHTWTGPTGTQAKLNDRSKEVFGRRGEIATHFHRGRRPVFKDINEPYTTKN